jgi:hypothetical protein
VLAVQPHEALTRIYERFVAAEPELPNGFAEHTPMGAEALLELGLAPERVLAWAEAHQPSTAPVASSELVSSERRRIGLEIETEGWRPVARRRVTQLLPDLGVHLFHGVIRTAHAVRALDHGVGPAAEAELATALAAWAAWAGGTTQRDPHRERSGDPVGRIIDAASRGAAAHLARPSIVTVHAVTAPMAVLLLADLVDRPDLAVAAAVFDQTHERYPTPSPDLHPAPVDDDVVDRVAAQWDAHPAKLVESAIRAHRITGQPVFTAVIRQVVDR